MSDDGLKTVARFCMKELAGDGDIIELRNTTGSTDMGDLSSVMPVMQPYIGGVEGGLHSTDFRITDPDTAYILGAKFLACTATELLWGNGETAESIKKNFKPYFASKEEYFKFIDQIFSKRILSTDSFYKLTR